MICPSNRDIYQMLLSEWGAKPVLAANAADALCILRERASQGRPLPLALIDYEMPDENGLVLARQIRADAAIASTKLIILSSCNSESLANDFEREDVSHYLAKPASHTLLSQALCDALSDANVERLREATDSAEASLVNTNAAANSTKQPVTQILVVDDNDVNRMVIQHMIDENKYAVSFAENGRIAVEAVKNNEYALIFMDVSMPVMSGLEATDEIRAYEKMQDKDATPIIALTAHAMEGDEERFIHAGMDGYLAKPVKKDLVEAIFKKWVPDAANKKAS